MPKNNQKISEWRERFNKELKCIDSNCQTCKKTEDFIKDLLNAQKEEFNKTLKTLDKFKMDKIIKQHLINIRNGAKITPVLYELTEYSRAMYFLGKKEAKKQTLETIRLLKLEYANTPLDKRGSGFEWLNKLEKKIKRS